MVVLLLLLLLLLLLHPVHLLMGPGLVPVPVMLPYSSMLWAGTSPQSFVNASVRLRTPRVG